MKGGLGRFAQFVRDARVGFVKDKEVFHDKIFVCGNEACDLDSIITALGFAYVYKSFQGKQLIPCINTDTPSIIDMRGEVKHVLGNAGIDQKDLVFVNEVFARNKGESSPVNFILIDHNELSGKWSRNNWNKQARIMGILDHHQDAGIFKEEAKLMRSIQVCGSTASLLVEKVQKEKHLLEAKKNLHDIVIPLLETIVFDTVNLTWRHKEVDVEACSYLNSVVMDNNEGTTCGLTIMKDLEMAIKMAPEENFDIYDLLQKDYKLYAHHSNDQTGVELYYGISTLHISFECMIGKNQERLEEWMGKVRKFMSDGDLVLLVITIAIREKDVPGHRQQLGIFANTKGNTKCIDATKLLTDELQDSHDAGLSLITSGEDFSLFNQENITIARKQLHPITKSFMTILFP